MNNIYRAHSPSRGEQHHATEHRDRAQGDTATLNQATTVFGGNPDWTIQTGTITWENPA